MRADLRRPAEADRRSPGPGRSPPAAARFLAGGRCRTRLIPGASPSVRRARRLRAVRAIGARRHPAPVRQPVLAAGHGSAVRRARARGARVHRAAVARCAIRREAVGWVSRGRREASRWRAHARAARLAGAAPLLVAGATGRTHRLRHRPAHPDPGRRSAGRRGDRPGVFAWAGHRHRGPGRCRHVPPGTSWTCCPVAPRDVPYLTSVGREKSPVGPRRPIVINCTYSAGIKLITPGIEMRRVTQPGRDTNPSRQGILSSRVFSAERPWIPGSSG